ncbi:unnamed protein product [Ilex paraguariensis]|uniref:Arogenate dehydratase n=1 Tax=Ilex paraguariensis TaxID=185542 RepID=A0ABC8SFL8_9AQUA
MSINLKTQIRTKSHSQTHSVTRRQPILQCTYRFDSTNAIASAASMVNFNTADTINKSRADWQSSFAILASTVVSKQQQIIKSDHITVVNDHKTLDHMPIENNLSNPRTFVDLSPIPKHRLQLRVAYQGVSGAYSEAAARKAYPKCEAITCDQFEDAFKAVELWIADLAVLPIENSVGGSIHRNYDLLLHIHMVGEIQIPVHHCLLAMSHVRKEDLNRVISHPQALSQCEHTLTKLGLNVDRVAVDRTANAAKFIATNNLGDTAAIASAYAAKLYGLQILENGIQDECNNVTRFVILAREPISALTDRPFKTSIVFAHDKGTSVLFKVLSAFAFRNISLTKIESRPYQNKSLRFDDEDLGMTKHFEYLFYVDFEASMAEVRAQNALVDVQEYTSFLRVLGSYPMDMTPWCPSRGD